jgi:SHS2 domain-containing protein
MSPEPERSHKPFVSLGYVASEWFMAILRMKVYELIDHTADIGIKVWGRTKKELFQNAAEAMFDLIVDKKTVKIKRTVKLNLKAPDIRELFVSWLRELLYQYSAKRMIFKKITVTDSSDTQINASASGEKIDNKRHIFKNDLKAVTYHGLDIKKTKAGWQTQVIFDV